jgi:hypothetical protein
MKADRKAHQARMDADREERKANQEKHREDLKEMREEIKSGQAEMRSTVYAVRSDLKETIQHGMKAVIQPTWSELDEMAVCQEATETKPDPGLMQSIEDYQEIPEGGAAVMLVGEPNTRRRVCILAAERGQKRKERTRGNRA